MKEYSSNSNFVMFDEEIGAVYTSSKKPSITKPKKTDVMEVDDHKIAPWGNSNDFPQLIEVELEKNSDLAIGLDAQARALVSGGIQFKFVDPYDESDIPKEKIDRAVLKEVLAFRKKSWAYPFHAAKNFYRLANVFPQFDLRLNRKRIDRLYVREVNHCRYSLQDQYGDVNWCYVNANWPDAAYDSKETIKLPVVDSIFGTPEEVREAEYHQFVYALSYPTGKTYYQLASWNGIRKNGWLELANSIPEWKIAIMKNQISVKYHIEFPDYYWTEKFGEEYSNWSAEKQAKARRKEFLRFNEILKGYKNAGKNISSSFKTDKATGKRFAGVEIKLIGEKFAEGVYLEDATEATIKIFSALGWDPSTFGITPGKGGVNRSGSDKRESFNIYLSFITPHADILLKPYDFISDYNGWNNEEMEIKWSFNKPLMQTLDQVTPSERETIIPEEDAT